MEQETILEKLKKARTKIISEMLDNLDEYDIFPTTKAYNLLDNYFQKELEQLAKELKYIDFCGWRFLWLERRNPEDDKK